MDPPFSGFVLDPSKCRNLSIQEKRELIRELSKWPESAPEKLQRWSRRDLLEILCVEMGKERKYTGVTKQKLIEHIFRLLAEGKSGEHIENTDIDPHLHPPPRPSDPQNSSKRQRKTDHPLRLPVVTSNLPVNNEYCLNLSCRAIVSQEDAFCKRCSCCICHKYDENKDPSLWLVCSSEGQSEGEPCGMSCHLECALKHERGGISKNGQCTRLDGCYYCIYCGKVNDLLRCWKKQLMIAKDARRVDVLCYRVSLSHKLLFSTVKYQGLHEIVDVAMKKLEFEVGPLMGLPSMARGIVNRLSVGAEVQRLCAHAVEALDSMLPSSLPADAEIHKVNPMASSFIKFEDISPTSVTVVLGSEDYTSSPPDLVAFTLWHRRADVTEYPPEPTLTLHKATRRFPVAELTPATEYIIKVIAFNTTRALAKWEARVRTETISTDVKSSIEGTSPKTNSSCLSNPSSEGDESNTCIGTTITMQATGPEETPGHSGSAMDEEPNSTIPTESLRDSTNSTENNQVSDVPKSDNESNTPAGNEMVVFTKPVPPCRLEVGKEGSGRSGKAKVDSNLLENGMVNPEREPGSSSKKRSGEKGEDKDGSLERTYEYCVKVVRWLECEGHMETSFRVKFLTWFSLRATPQERRVVSVYIDTLIDDPGSLAGQLVDSFTEAVCSVRPPPVRTGFCTRLWH